MNSKINICIYLNKNRCGFTLKLLNLKLPGALPAWGPPRALCRGKAQAEFTASCVFVKMEVNHFTCTLLKTVLRGHTSLPAPLCRCFETFRKYGFYTLLHKNTNLRIISLNCIICDTMNFNLILPHMLSF